MMEQRNRFYARLGSMGLLSLPVPPGTVKRLYPKMKDDDDSKAREFNYFVDRLLEVGQQVGAPTGTVTIFAIQKAVAAIVQDMGRGGGDYGGSCRKAVPGVVQDAIAKGYDITNANVLKAIESVVIAKQSAQYTTQMGNFKGGWRGGGFGEQ
ncbi:hypothetical protein [Azospirillum sp. A39]|uniref:hypothetical protein n=1 Tax=Azospirillum sp. A39 TaxID=3462279 RepID=UPI0040468439